MVGGVTGAHMETVAQPVEEELKIDFVSAIIQLLNTGERVVRVIRPRFSNATPRRVQQVRLIVLHSKHKMIHNGKFI